MHAKPANWPAAQSDNPEAKATSHSDFPPICLVLELLDSNTAEESLTSPHILKARKAMHNKENRKKKTHTDNSSGFPPSTRWPTTTTAAETNNQHTQAKIHRNNHEI